MKILFECNNGAYVVEVHPKRLYAKVEADKNMPVRYSSTISPLLNPSGFHEYRESDAMLQKKMEKAISDDLKKAMANNGQGEETKTKGL